MFFRFRESKVIRRKLSLFNENPSSIAMPPLKFDALIYGISLDLCYNCCGWDRLLSVGSFVAWVQTSIWMQDGGGGWSYKLPKTYDLAECIADYPSIVHKMPFLCTSDIWVYPPFWFQQYMSWRKTKRSDVFGNLKYLSWGWAM